MEQLHSLLALGWPTRPVTTLILLAVGVLYTRGWLRLRGRHREVAPVLRLVAFWGGWLLVAIAMLSPLFHLGQEMLLGRTFQQIALGLLAPPLIWIGHPFHVMVWGAPRFVRRWTTRGFVQDAPLGRAVRVVSRPGVVWLATLSLFLLWHDPAFVAWTVTDPGRFGLALWTFFGAFLLFWMYVVGTGPRRHPVLRPGLGFLYVILGGEIPNMVTGVVLSFHGGVLYAPYATGRDLFGLSPVQDQLISGETMWVAGTFMYVFIALGIMNRVFQPHGPMPGPVDWTATARTIAPGLEHRVPTPTERRGKMGGGMGNEGEWVSG